MMASLLLSLLACWQATFHADSTLVTVPAVVTDAIGAPVHDLQPAQLRVFDDGAPREICQVWREQDPPLAIGIIDDISASQRAFLREHRAPVDAFLSRLLHPANRGFLVAVNQNVTLEAEYVTRPSGLGQAVIPSGSAALGMPCQVVNGRSFWGGTALWNAVYAAAHEKLNRSTGSKALLLLSGGTDTGSIHHLDRTLEEVQRAGALVYAIRYPDPVADISGDGLAHLAAETGGAEFPPPSGDYRAVLDRIQADLRSHYVLGISPAPGSGVHQLRVEITRANLTVRARRQYMAPPE
jgi:VWFA-related protein